MSIIQTRTCFFHAINKRQKRETERGIHRERDSQRERDRERDTHTHTCDEEEEKLAKVYEEIAEIFKK